MALTVTRTDDIPKDAVLMDEMEATKYIWEVVSAWESLSDTWALLYGPVALGAINALSGLLVNKHFRTRLKLGTYGYLSSAIPISVMPGLLTTLFHRELVSTDLLLMKGEACPVCYEMRSAVIQGVLGIAYPLVLAPTSALMFANRYSTYRVPHLSEGPKVMFQFLKSKGKHLGSTLVFLSAFQFIASSVVTYFEMKNNYLLRGKMTAVENQLINEQHLE